MCGIFGSIFRQEPCVDLWKSSLLALAHRGPDDQGIWYDSDIGIVLGHSRLSILDLSTAGHQPMISDSGYYIIVFNGEIYNHLLLRRELERFCKSPQWRGHSDTETLLACFDAWGIETTVSKCIGMFAFAVWDKQKRILTLCRDRLGEKPLYYGWQGDTFLFGSELAALKVNPAFRADIDRNVLALFMRNSYIPAPYSIYKDIYKLLPGTLMRISCEHRNLSTNRYWDLRQVVADGLAQPFGGTPSEAVDALENLLNDAVAQQMVADVPVGAFLSGGIDSSTIVALMQGQSHRPIRTFTIGFHESRYNEAEYAKSVARHLGTDHTELYVTPQQALEIIPRLPVLYSEPFADSSQIPTFLVSQLAHQSVKVSLSGDAGDELFCGYRTYTIAESLWKKLSLIPNGFRSVLDRLSSSNPFQSDNQFINSVRKFISQSMGIAHISDKLDKIADIMSGRTADEMYQLLISQWANPSQLVIDAIEPTTVFTDETRKPHADCFIHQMMALDLLTYLPDNNLCKIDRAAMSVSLETRLPLLEHHVVQFAWSLPMNFKLRKGVAKWPLRQILYKYVPRKLIERPKRGFSIPIDSWLRGHLREWAENLLDESRLQHEGYLNAALVRKKWREHLSGNRNWQRQLWNVLIFQAWLENERKEMVA
jgi:asparagine synthase (glutamine-hydrolysing)